MLPNSFQLSDKPKLFPLGMLMHHNPVYPKPTTFSCQLSFPTNKQNFHVLLILKPHPSL